VTKTDFFSDLFLNYRLAARRYVDAVLVFLDGSCSHIIEKPAQYQTVVIWQIGLLSSRLLPSLRSQHLAWQSEK